MYITKEDLSEEARKALEGEDLEGKNFVRFYTLQEVDNLFGGDIPDEISIAIHQAFRELDEEDSRVHTARSEAIDRVMNVIHERVERMRAESGR